MAAMNAGPDTDRADMRPCADAAITDTRARADRTHMGASVHAMAVHAGTGLDHMPDMPACSHAAITGACAGADRADMGARAHAMAADVRAHTHAQHLHTCADIGKSQHGCEQGEREKANRQGFHGNPAIGSRGNGPRPIMFPIGLVAHYGCMSLVLAIAWFSMTALRYGGVLTVFAGVALFGVYFIAGNARPGRDGAIPSSSWRGAGPRKGIKIALLGVAMLVAAYAISLFMPNGG
jgi:hypothetical protein